MGHARARRFLNLIVDNRDPGVRSLRCMDLKRLQLFHPTTPRQPPTVDGNKSDSAVVAADIVSLKSECDVALAAAASTSRMERVCLPSPSFSFEACSTHGVGYRWNVGCFPLTDRKVLCTDQCGRNLLFDADTREVVTMPNLHKPKSKPISLFVPCIEDGSCGSLFLMEKIPQPVARCSIGQPSDDFEVLAYHRDKANPSKTSWHCKLLPPPPYVHEPSYWDTRSKITSYAVVGSGSVICISVEDRGIYYLDTLRHMWSKVGDWTLPFHGRVEYVPELKLWFGLSADAQKLIAADLSNLSAMDSEPQLLGSLKEFHPPEEWMERQDAQLVNLGSGRFCIARFFKTWVKDEFGLELYDQNLVVLTGVEVVPRVNDGSGNDDSAEVKLDMIPHKSKCHIPVNQTSIEELF